MAPTENAGPETAAAELAQAVGQILRRLRSEATSSELNLSEDAVLARLDAKMDGVCAKQGEAAASCREWAKAT